MIGQNLPDPVGFIKKDNQGMTLDLELVRRFVAVAETRSFRRAAEALGVSQPSLTRSIQQLEATFGDTLLERGARGVEFTPAGEALMEQAPELLAHAERVFRTTKISQESRRLRVSHSGLYPGLAEAFGAFQARWAGCELFLRQLSSAEQYRQIEDGKLDVGFVFGVQPNRELFNVETLTTARMLLAVPDKWSLGKKPQTRLSDFAGLPFISSSREANPYRREILEAKCRAAGFVPNVRHESNMLGDIHKLVAVGLGVALVTEDLSQHGLPGVKYLRLEEDLSDLDLHLSMIWVARKSAPVRQHFISTVLDAFNRS